MASSVGNLADVPADVSPPDPADVPLPWMIQPSVVAADRRAAKAAAKLVVALAFAADANRRATAAVAAAEAAIRTAAEAVDAADAAERFADAAEHFADLQAEEAARTKLHYKWELSDF